MNRLAAFALIGILAAVPAFADEKGCCAKPDGESAEPTEAPELSAEERADLVLMREEEKLARDVYRALLAKWEIGSFRNISGAEQRHMDALGGLLEKYGIEDPVGENPEGKFKSEELQKLHDSLVATGKKSEIDALRVGATIEDLDIQDLTECIGRTERQDILVVYQNLQKGSRNHLRAFHGQLASRDETYEPQHITKEEYDRIVSSPWERGRVNAEGKSDRPGRGEGRGRGRGRRGGRGHGRGRDG